MHQNPYSSTVSSRFSTIVRNLHCLTRWAKDLNERHQNMTNMHLSGEKRGEKEGDGKREEKESGEREEPALDGEKGLVRDWSGKTMNAGGVEK
ncbi:hypothetical protein TNCV_2697811 [Trichonephila clavipes]|nr:hypothetical protein TNCV_2697811 [Trichonephila clavipes]